MNWKDIKAKKLDIERRAFFGALVTAGSVRGAAIDLGMPPSTLSRALERHPGLVDDAKSAMDDIETVYGRSCAG